MKLTTPCISCQSPIKVPKYADDRVKIAMKKGDFLDLRCNECGKQASYHLNDVKASETPGLLLLVLLMSIAGATVGTIILWNHGWIASATIAVPAALYFGVMNSENKSISNFNFFTIKDKRNSNE